MPDWIKGAAEARTRFYTSLLQCDTNIYELDSLMDTWIERGVVVLHFKIVTSSFNHRAKHYTTKLKLTEFGKVYVNFLLL